MPGTEERALWKMRAGPGEPMSLGLHNIPQTRGMFSDNEKKALESALAAVEAGDRLHAQREARQQALQKQRAKKKAAKEELEEAGDLEFCHRHGGDRTSLAAMRRARKRANASA